MVARDPAAGGPRARPEDGYALVLALIVLLIASAAASLVAASLSLEMREARRELLAIELAALSDAAVADALARLAADSSYRGADTQSVGGGEISNRVDSLPGLRRLIVATATLAGRSRTVQVEVETTVGGLVIVAWDRQTPE